MSSDQLEARIKTHLLRGKTLTTFQCINMWGSYKLAEYVRRLRKKKYKITTTMVTKKGKTFARYSHTI